MKVLGISGPPIDSAVCLVVDGAVRAAAQEERFSRRPHDGALPIAALACCLEVGNVESPGDIDLVVFHGASQEHWLRHVLPDFVGRVVVAEDVDRELWRGIAPVNAAAAIRIARAASTDTAKALAEDPIDAALGPAYSSQEVRELLDRFDLPYEEVSDAAETIARVAAGKYVVGVLHGRMEFGDVSVGNRSLVAWGESAHAIERLDALTHKPGFAARVTETERTTELLRQVDVALNDDDPRAAVVHAPFRVAGEPTVCSPIDAYRGMMRGNIDALVMENVLVWRHQQPPWEDASRRP